MYSWLFEALGREVRNLNLRLAASSSHTASDSEAFGKVVAEYKKLAQNVEAITQAEKTRSLRQALSRVCRSLCTAQHC